MSGPNAEAKALKCCCCPGNGQHGVIISVVGQGEVASWTQIGGTNVFEFHKLDNLNQSDTWTCEEIRARVALGQSVFIHQSPPHWRACKVKWPRVVPFEDANQVIGHRVLDDLCGIDGHSRGTGEGGRFWEKNVASSVRESV